MATATAGVVTVGSLVISGFTLGIGFWMAKKVTNYVEAKLIERDPNFPNNLYPAIPAPIEGI